MKGDDGGESKNTKEDIVMRVEKILNSAKTSNPSVLD